MELNQEDWKRLARAVYSLAHNAPGDFEALEQRLKETEAGRLCSEYLATGKPDLLEKAGVLLTGTQAWYVYLGRTF